MIILSAALASSKRAEGAVDSQAAADQQQDCPTSQNKRALGVTKTAQACKANKDLHIKCEKPASSESNPTSQIQAAGAASSA